MDSFNGTHAIITGGSSGIGLSLARQLHQRGCSVAICARDKQRLGAARESIIVEGDSNVFVDVIPADVTSEQEVKETFTRHVNDRGIPDYLFNCAGMAEPGYMQDFTIAQFEHAMRIDYLGTVIPTMELLPRFLERGRGHVVNVSSVGGFLGIIGYGTYSPAKFAVMGFSEVLRHEMKPRGIKVSVVCPPDVDTPGLAKENELKPEECKKMSETAKLMTPGAVASVILKGVEKNKFHILPGDAAFLFRVKGTFPGLAFSIADKQLRKVRQKMEKRD